MKNFYEQPRLTIMCLAVDVLASSGEDSFFNLNWTTFDVFDYDEGGEQK